MSPLVSHSPPNNIDKAIGVIYEACKKNGYTLFVTADHGNAEKMLSEEGTPHTAHTCAKVPFAMSCDNFKFVKDTSEAALCDVAPTVLKVMGLPVAPEMTGSVIVEKAL
jgi:2,3-bisphosphoglycerate-independent phosphoglycerate mutase